MLGAANRDAALFPDPDCFDIDRPNVQRHLGFATGTHSCLGFNLARTEARIALQVLLSELDGLQLRPLLPGTRSISRAGTRLLVANVPRPLLA
jgi:cytochrome P450